MRNGKEIGLSRETGYAVVFFGLALVCAVIAYQLFSDGELWFGGAITAFALLMAGTGAFNLRLLLKRHRTEQAMKKRREEG